MTREEAIACWREIGLGRLADEAKQTMRPLVVDREIDAMAASDVDGFVALGMLKLNEPIDPANEPGGTVGKIRRFLREVGLGHMSPTDLDSALIRAGLEIVANDVALPESPQVTEEQP